MPSFYAKQISLSVCPDERDGVIAFSISSSYEGLTIKVPVADNRDELRFLRDTISNALTERPQLSKARAKRDFLDAMEQKGFTPSHVDLGVSWWRRRDGPPASVSPYYQGRKKGIWFEIWIGDKSQRHSLNGAVAALTRFLSE